jgi:CDP-diacylglycerol---serine O-phosphatidyltransferase
MKLISFEKMQHSSKKNLFLIPFFFTFGNALCGFMSVIKTLDEEYMLAAFFILLAALMDLCDGRLARWFRSTSVLGMELDSLCDAISFCFAPAILLYSWSLYQLSYAGMIVLGLFLCAGLFRLARFNANSGIPTTSFVGLPTTFAAFFFANIIIYEKWLATSVFASVLRPDRLAFLVTVIALLMISSIKFPSIKYVKLTMMTALVIGLCTAMGAYALIKGYPIFLAIAVTYIIASFALAIFKEITKSWWENRKIT